MQDFTAILKNKSTYRIVADSVEDAWRQLTRMGVEFLYVDSVELARLRDIDGSDLFVPVKGR